MTEFEYLINNRRGKSFVIGIAASIVVFLFIG